MAESATLSPDLQQMYRRGVGHLQAGEWDQAESVYRVIVAQRPEVPEVQINLGAALKRQGKLEEAIAVFRTALALRPNYAEVLNSLGDALRESNRLEEAIDACRKALALRPDFPQALNNLGIALSESKRSADAVEALHRAVALWPEFGEAWSNLGGALRDCGRLTEAAEAYRRAVTLRPELRGAWRGLGNTFFALHSPHEALDAYRRALELPGDPLDVYGIMVLAYMAVGGLDEALDCLDRGVELKPEDPDSAGSRVCFLHYHPRFDAAAIFHEARRWGEQFAAPLSGAAAAHDNDRSPRRRLRIGYVSADFRQHCAAKFLMPLLTHHDHRAFEIVCYSGVSNPDQVTHRLRHHADLWRDVAEAGDEELAKMIRQDGIDILVDLSLHTHGSRLLAFARKPAPVQVTWLGYPGTTGLGAIDYRLTDPRLDPPVPGVDGEPGPPGVQEEFYSERSIHLPDCFWCYDPREVAEADAAATLEPGLPPALSAGHVTFGCLNNFCKVSDAALDLWSRVLNITPGSKMLLMSPPGPHRDRVAEKLGLQTPGRVQFVPFQAQADYMATYRRIDICLDTLPCGGGTTSFDALWMGVPLVTRVGKTVVGRAGWSILHNLGLTELVARTDEEFVRAAAGLAGDIDRLRGLRATLRQRMLASPLMDGAAFARNLEAAYRQMWDHWWRQRSG